MVLSPLGQPLLAEVEIVALQPGEEESLNARLAAPDVFQQAGIELSPVLLGLRVSMERRNKRPYLRLTTPQAVNEPFLDVLIELQWSSGRLVREYTFLLDPPEYKSRQQAIAAAPPPPPPPAPQAVAPVQKPAPIEEKPIPAAPPAAAKPAQEAPASAPAAEAPKEAAKEPEKEAAKEEPEKEAANEPEKQATKEPATGEAKKHEVKKGETLGAIARANLQPNVTLSQMLIAIFRANEEAFIRKNVNLVRTGKILNIPSAEEIDSIDPEEASRLVKEQQAQFTDYRSRLAAVPSTTEGGAPREVTGKIEPTPQTPAPAAPSDQVRLSKVEPSKPAASGTRAAREDDAVARERALQEAQSRTKDLEKNLADLQKLLELKNQQLGELEKKAGAKPAPAPVPPVAQAPAEKPAAAAPPAEKKAEAPKPKSKPAPPPPPEPSLIDEFMENPLYLGALAAIVVLLLVYAAWSLRKKKAARTKFQDSVLGAAAAGGGAAALHESTATTAAGSTVSHAALSKAPAGMEAEEVDPIAEADVYMAYGRDAQAEEILKEALQKDSRRSAVHGKLLEIYANRKDTNAFEQAALKLKNLTHGSGPEWEKAAALGRSIDPHNSVYGEVSGAAAPASPAAPAAGAAPMLDFDLGGASQGAGPAPDISLDEPGKDTSASGVDFDLGATQTVKLDKQTPEHTVGSAPARGDDALEFNLDLGMPEEKKPQAPAKPADEKSGGLDFDLSLGGDEKPGTPAGQAPSLDLSSINLDLGGAGEDSMLAPQGASDPKWQEVATKLDLAKAYEEMGDKDGARDLLNEVMKDGDSEQKGQAQQLLAKLG